MCVNLILPKSRRIPCDKASDRLFMCVKCLDYLQILAKMQPRAPRNHMPMNNFGQHDEQQEILINDVSEEKFSSCLSYKYPPREV